MKFEQPVLLLVAPALALVVGLLAWLARRRRIRAATAWSPVLGARATELGRWSPVVLGAVALLACLGLAGPRWGRAVRSTESRALNIAMVVDVSRSMLAEDVAPSRLQRAVALARRTVQDLPGDRFALIAFAARGYVLAPLTLDQSALVLNLDALDPDIASEGGSGLAAALDQARQVLGEASQGGDRAIVVFTDGESFESEGDLAAAGRALKRDRITLVMVPVGDVRGARIPSPGGGWHQDGNGNDVVTMRRDDLVKVIADAADGVTIAPGAPDASGDVRRVLDRLARAPATDVAVADLIPRAWLFALAAGVVLLLHAATRRSAALAGLLLAVLAGDASAQRPSAGNRLLQRGDTGAARSSFLAEAKRLGTDSAWFNAGTAALLVGDYDVALPALARAAMSLDPGLRQRALYNQGTAELMLARRDGARRDSLVSSAASRLQSALQLDPTDRNAKYNYELARRLKPPTPPPSGGGGASDKSPPKPAPPPPPSGGMSQSQAEQVLAAMERAERLTRQEQNRRQRRGTAPTGPDW